MSLRGQSIAIGRDCRVVGSSFGVPILYIVMNLAPTAPLQLGQRGTVWGHGNCAVPSR